jgi:UDP-2,4-diacetamido-2,4,6-trideoxy-beta-L-altropyranose hydrolase
MELSAINDQQPAKYWFVVDGYHFDASYQKAIRDVGIHLLVIDDMNHLPQYHADILLNQNTLTPDMEYNCDEDTVLLLGTRYVLLRREFLKYQDMRRQIPDRAKNILITIGGADPGNVTLKVIQALNLLNESSITVRVIIGPANPHQDTLREAIASAHFNAEILADPADMPELMAWADMAVTAAGSTCWELALMQVPSIILVIAENQVNIADYLMNKKAVLNLGIFTKCSKKQICEACKNLIDSRIDRTYLSQQIKTLITRQGANRIIKSMKRQNLTLRNITEFDRELIWKWANDEKTRKASYSNAYITWEEHIRWFDSVHQQQNHRFYIAINESRKPVGQIRFALDDKDAIVSFSVAPDSRRKSYGKEILTRGADKLFHETNIEQILAYIKTDNISSLRVFHEAGFLLMEEVVFSEVKSYKMVLRRPTLS